jgi:hypothetical protein
MSNEKKKGLFSVIKESMKKTGGCCGPGESCCGSGNNQSKDSKSEKK